MKSMTTIALVLLGAATATARADLITNGNFESFTGGYGIDGLPSKLSNSGTGGYSAPTGWTVGAGTSYAFLMAPGAADTVGSHDPVYGDDTMRLWGSNNGGPDVIPYSSPAGGNYLAVDGDSDFRGTGISQMVNDLVVGQQYYVSFYWASAQQSNRSGAYTTQWDVSLGDEHHLTTNYTNPSHSFRDWELVTFVFTATAVSEKLNFLAIGTPGSLPPFVLLDGVTMSAVPEPSSIVLSAVTLMSLGAFGVHRRLRAAKA